MELFFIYMLLYSYSPNVLKHASFEVGFHFRKQKNWLVRSQLKKVGDRQTHEALHYHVRMDRVVVEKKEPTALLRKPKISRTLRLKLRCWGENFDLKWRNLERKNSRRIDEFFLLFMTYYWIVT